MHYLKTVLVNFKKSRVVTAFNLLGLSVSFAAFMLLSIYLWNEFTYDQFNVNYKHIYRLNIVTESDGKTDEQFNLPNPMADIIFKDIPELKNICSFAGATQFYSYKTDPTSVFSLNTKAVDSTFTDIFTIKIKVGNSNPLSGKNKIIISEKAAHRIFGDQNPIGKVIMANLNKPYVIEAVFYDLPYNNSFNYEAFCSYPTNDWVNDWSEWSFIHFYEVTTDADFGLINNKILKIPAIADLLSNYPDEKISFSFTPLKDIHFNQGDESSNLLFSKTLVLVAILLLFMAFINYINFAIANTPKMIKSANIRRVVGESRLNLVLMSIFESVILMIAAFLIALAACIVTLPFWQNIFGFPFTLSHYYLLLLLCLSLFITVGAIASLYPARLITKVKPALALKGIVSSTLSNGTLGKILTIIQYTISIVLIISILFIEKQISYVKNYDLGFNTENIIEVVTSKNIVKQQDAFTSELLKNPNITDYAFSQFIPGGVGMSWGRTIDGKRVNYKCWPVDERYLNFMGFKILKGRNFSSNINADENNFIFNQKAIDEFGWQNSAIGKEVPGFDFSGKLVGIVENIKYASLHEKVQPMAFWLTKTRHNRLSLKINGSNINKTIAYIKNVYSKFEKSYPFSYTFLDDSLNRQYKSEDKEALLIFIFSIISIIISIIGALGLIIFITEYRIKEIGIRKVNGATVINIMLRLSINFFKWILVAYIIAVPIAYYLVSNWLSSFAYKTTLSWWVFALAGIVMLIISLLTISWQSWRAAVRNPAVSLRNE